MRPRRRPDPERISALELELGMREPTFVEQFADPHLMGWSEPALTRWGERRRAAQRDEAIRAWDERHR